jgi:enamine deaminase RidA (YjgF/YER057c/UK114 family)
MPRQSRSLCKELLLSGTSILAFASAQAADSVAARKPQFLNSPQAEQRGLPFSEAVRAGDFLFLAGQVGDDRATGKVVPGGIVPEARQTLQHIKDTLERNGSSLSDVVKCTVFLASASGPRSTPFIASSSGNRFRRAARWGQAASHSARALNWNASRMRRRAERERANRQSQER